MQSFDYWYARHDAKTAAEYIREKLEVAHQKIRSGLYTVVDFTINNPEQAAVIGGALVIAVRKADKWADIYREEKLRNSTIYDRSLGMYWQTKRPLTANQRLIIESRHKAGEPYGKILSEMKLLKR